MITGKVTSANEAFVQVGVTGTGAQSTQIDAVIDTGFTGYLTLPSSVILSLGLRQHGIRKAQLANGDIVIVRTYRAAVDWNGESRGVQIVEAGGSPLLGMSMLRGFRLCVDVEPEGQVVVERLS